MKSAINVPQVRSHPLVRELVRLGFQPATVEQTGGQGTQFPSGGPEAASRRWGAWLTQLWANPDPHHGPSAHDSSFALVMYDTETCEVLVLR